ncbi:hypothetical protein PAAG_11659 [Paracoccidioides lutzii Pb01]|uniref:Uncharacterized protein n=1 Tax=Paracoccidioides lutzii (strain ATCC MYA-826 / Pb01) TaxID=502779 RepID=A0A0A2V5T6_PARBA|nr:hypothetical protein PAAG_11659 [Paracoccidioides lutzii Pb01]KGQ01667.1 hypothetical protein PAAG_11659 [Paracoccidioides lutzii Pb01]
MMVVEFIAERSPPQPSFISITECQRNGRYNEELRVPRDLYCSGSIESRGRGYTKAIEPDRLYGVPNFRLTMSFPLVNSVVVVEDWSSSGEKKQEIPASLCGIESSGQCPQISSNPIRNPRSSTPGSQQTLCPNHPVIKALEAETLKEDIRLEKDSYETLIKEGGIPSHPFGLGLDIIDDPPEQYEELISFSGSLEDFWKISANSEVWERQQKYETEDNTLLHQNRDEQSKYEDWIEYQDYSQQLVGDVEKRLADGEQQLVMAPEELKNAGFPVDEKMNERIMDGVALAFMQNMSKEKQLKLAEERLQRIESEDRLGDSIIVKDWIRLSQEEPELGKGSGNTAGSIARREVELL